jgi:hypothetical protein
MPPSNVTLILKGSLILFAKEGQTIGNVGILKYPPPMHELTIVINKQPPGGSMQHFKTLERADIKRTLRLDIRNTAHPTITFRNKNPIDRLHAPTEEESYRWFVDLENSEHYGTKIGASKAALSPILTFNSGELYTEAISEGLLYEQPGIFAQYEKFGFVALSIGIDFISAESAAFINGTDREFDSTSEPGTNYEIELINDLPDDVEHSDVVNDADHYYKAVGLGIPVEQRILFMSVAQAEHFKTVKETARLRKDKKLEEALSRVRKEDFPAGPEAACFPAFMGQTDL